MHSITNYIHKWNGKSLFRGFLWNLFFELTFTLNLVATIGNVRIVVTHNNKNVKILIKYSKLQISLSLNIDRLFSPKKCLEALLLFIFWWWWGNVPSYPKFKLSVSLMPWGSKGVNDPWVEWLVIMMNCKVEAQVSE